MAPPSSEKTPLNTQGRAARSSNDVDAAESGYANTTAPTHYRGPFSDNDSLKTKSDANRRHKSSNSQPCNVDNPKRFVVSTSISGQADKMSHKRDVQYDDGNHLAVMTQMYGSVWPRVLPWCCAMLGVTWGTMLLRNYHIVDLTINNTNGHTFMSILVSFLVVTRATITYNRFMEARQGLEDLYRCSRELGQYTCILSMLDQSDAAKQWRQDVAYRVIVTLRLAIAAVEFRSHGINAWELLPTEDHEHTELIVHHQHREQDKQSVQAYSPRTNHSAFLTELAHGPRTLLDENFRAPIVWAYNLREKILEHRRTKCLTVHPLHATEDMRLLNLVGEFMQAFHGLKKLITTPFPFPLVQMTKSFLFFWVFSLPCVLVNNDDWAFETSIIIFFCTYGFLGLEYVNDELADPFGKDPNDFPGQRWAEIVFEDIYISLYKTDGYASAAQLRSRITDRIAKGDALANYQTEMNALLQNKGPGLMRS